MTNLTGSANFAKYVLFLINFFLVITGIIILSIGVTVQGVYHGYSNFLSDQFFSVPELLIAIGAIIFIISFFGCCGAIRENYCMVITFDVLLVLVFILELAAGISGYVLRNETKALLTENLRHTLPQYNQTEYLYIAKLWDEVQTDFSCCGLVGAVDWMEALNNSIPVSCCAPVTAQLNNVTCAMESATLFKDGCVQVFGDFIKAHAVSLGSVGLSLALIQLFGIFLTCYIAKRIKKTGHHSSF